MFSIAPLTSLSAMTPPVDSDPVASFRDLIAVPPDTAHESPHLDPRQMRTMVDRGIVEYASAKSEGDRARGASLIQTAALLGYPPARDLLARNYPRSEAVRSVVPANDVIRYALGPVMDAAATGEDSKKAIGRRPRRSLAKAQKPGIRSRRVEFPRPSSLGEGKGPSVGYLSVPNLLADH